MILAPNGLRKTNHNELNDNINNKNIVGFIIIIIKVDIQFESHFDLVFLLLTLQNLPNLTLPNLI